MGLFADPWLPRRRVLFAVTRRLGHYVNPTARCCGMLCRLSQISSCGIESRAAGRRSDPGKVLQ